MNSFQATEHGKVSNIASSLKNSTFYRCRYACAIQDQQDVVITGGTFSNEKVIKYLKIDGTSQNLPDLNQGYLLHACGLFLNSDGETVSLEK